jgi:hypothetical protein
MENRAAALVAWTALLVLMTCPGPLQAAQVNLVANGRFLVSDNINRVAPGQEQEGSLFGFSVGARIEEMWNQTTLDMTGSVGREFFRGATDQADTTYNFILEYDLNWSPTFYSGISGVARKSTGLADTDNLDRVRDISNTREVEIRTGRVSSPTSGWEISTGGSWVSRGGEQTNELMSAAESGWDLTDSSSLKLNALITMGEESESGNRWESSEGILTFTRRLVGDSSLGFFIDGADSEVEYGSTGVLVRVENAGLSGFMQRTWSENTSFSTSVGMEMVAIDGFEPENNLRGQFDYSLGVGPEVVAGVNGSYSVQRLNAAEDTLVWDRRTIMGLDLTWNISSRFMVITEAAYIEDELLADGELDDRTDEGSRTGLRARWDATRSVAITFNAQQETIASTEPTAELEENRFEILAMGTF